MTVLKDPSVGLKNIQRLKSEGPKTDVDGRSMGGAHFGVRTQGGEVWTSPQPFILYQVVAPP